MASAKRIRKGLLSFCESHHDGVRFRHESGKQIAAGLRRAIGAIEAVPPAGPAADYLEELRAAVESCRKFHDDDPGDPDGWALGGIRTVLNEIERLQERQKRLPRWWPW